LVKEILINTSLKRVSWRSGTSLFSFSSLLRISSTISICFFWIYKKVKLGNRVTWKLGSR
jgi:hypothetical protein